MTFGVRVCGCMSRVGLEVMLTVAATRSVLCPPTSDMVADAGAMAVQYGFKADLCGPMLKAQAAGEPLPQAYAAFVAKMWGADFGQNCFYSTSCLKNDPSQYCDAVVG